MKRRTAQEEQIGTAAVDLFASGMGAFILIAVVFMVLFAATPRMVEVAPPPPTPPPEAAVLVCPPPEPRPQVNVCQDCPAPVVCPAIPEPPACPAPAVAAACPEIPVLATAAPLACPAQPACPACPICPSPVEQVSEVADVVEELLASPPATLPIEPEALVCPLVECTTLLPEFDLVFVVDSTSSMHNEIESLKRELHIVVEVLERIMPTVGVGVVTFNDRLQRPAVRHHPLRRLTNDEGAMVDIQRFLRGITAGDGRGTNTDIPEAVLSALEAAVSTSFRDGVRNRSVIVITDAYAYEDETQESLALARAFSAVDGQRVSTVHVQANPQSERYLEQLAEAGAGAFVPDRGSILANVLLSIL